MTQQNSTPPTGIDGAEASSLADLLANASGDESIWQGVDLRDVLEHQLAAPLTFSADGGSSPHSAVVSSGKPIASFAQLLFVEPKPPLELLLLAKDFAKTAMTSSEPYLPREVATLLYYASLIAARLRLGKRVSSLDDAAIGQGIAWALDQRWVDGQARAFFVEARSALNP